MTGIQLLKTLKYWTDWILKKTQFSIKMLSLVMEAILIEVKKMTQNASGRSRNEMLHFIQVSN